MMTTFSPSYFPDLFSLVVFVKEGRNFVQMATKIFEPFSPSLWVVVVVASIFVGFTMWFLGEVEHNNIFMGTLSGTRMAFMKFLGQGGFASAKTRGGSIVLFGFGFMCMLGASSYTANLASILLTSHMDTAIKDINDAIKQQVPICILEPLKGPMLGKYPTAEKLLVYKGWFDEIVAAMDAGECLAGLINENDYGRMRAGLPPYDDGSATKHCNKISVGNVLLSIPLGIPIQADIEKAVGYLMVDMKFKGVLGDELRKFPTPIAQCKAGGMIPDAQSMSPSDLTGVLIMVAVALILGAAVHAIQKKIAERRAQQEEANAEEWATEEGGVQGISEIVLHENTDSKENEDAGRAVAVEATCAKLETEMQTLSRQFAAATARIDQIATATIGRQMGREDTLRMAAVEATCTKLEGEMQVVSNQITDAAATMHNLADKISANRGTGCSIWN